MSKKYSKRQDDNDYLSEFRQKIATQKQEILEERRQEMHQVRNGFIGTLAGVFLAGVIGWVLLMPRFSDPQSTVIPVIRRQAAPVKIQPTEPGGMEILNQDKSIYNLVEKKETEPTKVESLLPQPENPVMPTIVPEPEIEKTTDKVQTEVNTLEEKALDELIEAVETDSNQKITIPEKPKELKVEAKIAEKSIETKAVPEKKKSEAAKIETKQTEIKKGLWQIQIMASSNKQAVEKAWSTLSGKHTFLKDQPHEVEEVKTNAGAKVYRLKAGSFATRNEADQLCQKLKTAGGNCLVKQK